MSDVSAEAQCAHKRCPDCTPEGYQRAKAFEAAAYANHELRMTLRDRFAMAALPQLVAWETTEKCEETLDEVALDAYRWADAMMGARQPPGEGK